MQLKRLTATFGRLEQETLDLRPGLNVITAPNESGKSTWASFLLAMLYGVDTSERAARGVLPAKTRYKPWSGAAMSGSVELEWQGRELTLERSARGRAPMAELRVYETASGLPVELREDECGRTILGVERSVYERSGFIRQQGIALSADHALESRLNSLVTTGDESVSFSAAEKRLRDLKNRRRHNKTGLLPQAEERLRQVEARLAEQAALGREATELQARCGELEAERGRLERFHAALEARENADKRRQLEEAREDWEKKSRFLEEKKQTVEGLPPIEDLQALLRELDALAESGRQLAAENEPTPPEAPDCPPVFRGCDAAQVREKAETDAKALEALRPVGAGAFWTLLILALCAIAAGAAGLAFARMPLGLAGLAAGAVLLGLALLRRGKAGRVERARRAILEPYGAGDAAALHRIAGDYQNALALYQERSENVAAQREALEARREAHRARRDELFAEVRRFAPEADGPAAAQAAVQKAVNLRKFYLASCREAEQARVRYEAVETAIGDLPDAAEAPAEPVEGDIAAAARQLAAVREELSRTRSRLDLDRGRLDASGDPAALAAEREELTGRIERWEREYQALSLAMDALSTANDALQTRFAPQINELAAQYLARMTGGRYDRVLLGRDMDVSARETGGALTHPLAALSAGTADQVYLSVRLAISALLLPPDAPLVLDDTLTAFDDDRLAAAMALLEELSRDRQILVFTCQSREQRWLDAHGEDTDV